MTPKGKKALIISISLLAIGGVVGYIFWKKAKDKKDAQAKIDADAKAELDAKNSSTGTDSGGVKGGTGGASSVSNPVGDSEGVKKFQDWLDTKYPTWLKGGKLLKGSGYGNFGNNTSKAWTNYGAEYQKVIAVMPPPVVMPPSTPKVMNLYAKAMGTPIWDDVSDWTPYRFVGAGESLGTTDGTIVKSYTGSKFYKLNFGGKTKYVAIVNVSFNA